jgi:hypothetical protein
MRLEGTHGPSRQFRTFAAIAGFLCAVGGMAACSSTPAGSTVETSTTVEPAQPGATATVAAIEVTTDGFVPDRIEVAQGTRITVRNATESKQSVVVKGRDFQGSGDGSIALEPGQTLDLNLYQLGAYVLTLGNDPQVAASIFIS